MAAAVLNTSVDIPDYKLYRNPDSEHNTRINEMESVAEIVAECVMNMPNEFPEKKNDDHNSAGLEKKVMQFINEEKPENVVPAYIHFTVTEIILPEEFLPAGYISEITPPPPKA